MYTDALNTIYDIDSLNQILVYFVVAFQRHTHVNQPAYKTIRQYIVVCIDNIIPAGGKEKFQFIRGVINWAVDDPLHKWQDHLMDNFEAFDNARRDLSIKL